MAKNMVGPGLRVQVTAGANRSSGDFVFEGGFHGVHVNDVASGDLAVLDITEVEIQIPKVSGVAKGNPIYIGNANALSTADTNHRLVGICTEVENVRGVPAGFMRMKVLPQNATAPSAA